MNKEEMIIREILKDFKTISDSDCIYELSSQDCKLLLDYITNLQEENEKLSIELNACMIERNNYLSKIDKAIELIKNECLDENEHYCCDLWGDDIYKLLSILRGEDNE